MTAVNARANTAHVIQSESTFEANVVKSIVALQARPSSDLYAVQIADAIAKLQLQLAHLRNPVANSREPDWHGQ